MDHDEHANDLGVHPRVVSRVAGLVSLVGASPLSPLSHDDETEGLLRAVNVWIIVIRSVGLRFNSVIENASVQHLCFKDRFDNLLWPVYIAVTKRVSRFL